MQNAKLLTSPTTILLISHKAPFSKYAYANNTHSKPRGTLTVGKIEAFAPQNAKHFEFCTLNFALKKMATLVLKYKSNHFLFNVIRL